MAKPNRKCVKPIIKPLTQRERIELIKNGEGKENYPKWAKSAPIDVRVALAENKYELDVLVKDQDPDVLIAVMKNSKEHLRKVMQSANKIELVRLAIQNNVNIDDDILENQIQQAEKRKKIWKSHYENYISALKAKRNKEEWAKELTLKDVMTKLWEEKNGHPSLITALKG